MVHFTAMVRGGLHRCFGTKRRGPDRALASVTWELNECKRYLKEVVLSHKRHYKLYIANDAFRVPDSPQKRNTSADDQVLLPENVPHKRYDDEIHACARNSRRVLELFTEMRKFGVHASQRGYNIVLDACVKLRMWQHALDALRAMDAPVQGGQRAAYPYLARYNSILRVCEEAHQWSRVIDLLEEMPQRKARSVGGGAWYFQPGSSYWNKS